MTLSVSIVLLLLVIVVVLVRKAGLNLWHALACILLGFYLAGSSVAPAISEVTGNIAATLSGVHP
ncbi:hypothetical protein ACFW9F_30360 [Streptomyces sp. NPDC059506]|uniref:Membrane protein n=1 Tax=Streptomyces thermolineatus TaxID=44033 RepID=A0ABP5ZG92_9ACTN|nr:MULTISPECIES: hypothetical protein [unclassified Streptomyces]MCZ2526415.1 hypothetical protein [Streptomyces sp. HB2AG]PLW72502.1 hypothetical protein C0036_12280 [Streptomyces sp. DJ]QMV24500.1 hypothetical protein GQS52_25055 [Streptomyces sp. SCUT-3]